MTPRVRLSGVLTAAVLAAAIPVLLQAADERTATITFGATVAASTSLRLSTTELRVEPRRPGDAGPVIVGSVAFVASARTRTRGDVVLTVEAQRSLEELGGGAADGATTIDFSGDGAGAMAGVLRSAPEVVARWQGSGQRDGRVTFTLRGQGPASDAVIPLRFVLSTP